MAWALAGLSAAVLVVLVAGGFGAAMWRRRWLVADTPTSDAAHVFIGTNEIVGRAEPLDRPIATPYSAIECVWFRSILEKGTRDEEGRVRWSTVSDDSSVVPFWVADDSGRVLIRPEGASVYAKERRRDEHSGRPSRSTGLSVLRLGMDTLGPSLAPVAPHRSTEWLIRPGDEIYVLGEATLRDDAVALELAPCDRGSSVRRRSLLIATGDERGVARRTRWQGLLLLVVLLAGVVGLAAAGHAVRTSMDGGPVPGDPPTVEAARGWAVLGVAAVLALLPIAYVARMFNRLVATRNRVERAWSLIDVNLRRRHDLIPRLAQVVAGAATHERESQVIAATARSTVEPPPTDRGPEPEVLAQAAEVDRIDEQRSRTLIALAEDHPTLLVDQNFRALADDIVATEDAVAFARTFYNDAVNVMADRRQRFPGSLLARLVREPHVGRWRADQPEARPATSSVAPVEPVDDQV